MKLKKTITLLLTILAFAGGSLFITGCAGGEESDAEEAEKSAEEASKEAVEAGKNAADAIKGIGK